MVGDSWPDEFTLTANEFVAAVNHRFKPSALRGWHSACPPLEGRPLARQSGKGRGCENKYRTTDARRIKFALSCGGTGRYYSFDREKLVSLLKALELLAAVRPTICDRTLIDWMHGCVHLDGARLRRRLLKLDTNVSGPTQWFPRDQIWRIRDSLQRLRDAPGVYTKDDLPPEQRANAPDGPLVTNVAAAARLKKSSHKRPYRGRLAAGVSISSVNRWTEPLTPAAVVNRKKGGPGGPQCLYPLAALEEAHRTADRKPALDVHPDGTLSSKGAARRLGVTVFDVQGLVRDGTLATVERTSTDLRGQGRYRFALGAVNALRANWKAVRNDKDWRTTDEVFAHFGVDAVRDRGPAHTMLVRLRLTHPEIAVKLPACGALRWHYDFPALERLLDAKPDGQVITRRRRTGPKNPTKLTPADRDIADRWNRFHDAGGNKRDFAADLGMSKKDLQKILTRVRVADLRARKGTITN